MKSSEKERSSDSETASFERTLTSSLDKAPIMVEEAPAPAKANAAVGAAKKPSEWLLKISQQSMVRLIDAIFDLLQMCAYEINQATEGTELELSWLRPAPEKEKTFTEGEPGVNAGVNKDGIVTGRISTRYWTLAVRGTALEIRIFILPAEKLLGFNANSDLFEPYGKLTARPLGTGVGWYIENTLLEREHVTLIGKHLMETLMKCARHEKLNPGGFTTTLLGINSTDSQEREVQRQYREQFFADLKARLDSNSGAYPKQVQSESTVPEMPKSPDFQSDSWAQKETKNKIEPVLPDNGWSTADNNPAAAYAKPEQKSPTTELPADKSPRPSFSSAETQPEIDINVQTADDTQQSSQVTENQVSQSGDILHASPDAGTANMIDNDLAPPVVSDPLSSSSLQSSSPVSLPQALQILMESLDLELEAISQAGAQAFSDKDFARAQAILEFSARLSEFRQSAKQLHDDYQGEG